MCYVLRSAAIASAALGHACLHGARWGHFVEEHHSDKMDGDLLDIRSNKRGAAAEKPLGISVGT